jgi:hypothetical protein
MGRTTKNLKFKGMQILRRVYREHELQTLLCAQSDNERAQDESWARVCAHLPRNPQTLRAVLC